MLLRPSLLFPLTLTLVSGPSGLGYTYPRFWPLQKLAEYTHRSAADALGRGGLRVITEWNDGQILSGAPAAT